jgi:hypothetical protein
VAIGVAAVVAVCVVPASAFALGTTGDAKAIAFYRSAVAATNNLSSYVQTQTGYVRIISSVGKTDSSNWAWGNQQFRHGYYATHERLVIVQSAGKVVWIEDTLRPILPKCTTTICNTAFPIQFFITKTSAFEGIVTSGTTASCFRRQAFIYIPYRAGGPWWFTGGYYLPMAVRGGQTVIVSKFPSGGQQVTETDSIATAKRLFVSSVIHLAAHGSERAYVYSNHDVVLAARPKPPKITLCS